MKKKTIQESISVLLQAYYEGIEEAGPGTDVDFDNGDTVHLSENAISAMQTRDVAVSAVDAWFATRLAAEGLAFVR